ncbi:hypothetical protein HBI37_021440 [Parastagonospora nodorum]|nr:hypothetical protein HBH49_058950 [Parastagonospora nodorum]KAH5696128.1 hypothetical protein HBI44_111790 [Parastagonospora nodorum]KAH6074128.1 hypothetical protein HBI67_062940 [Parastagonospora nodorum]KAH6184023.1 hypothetical protein HBI68_013370 [Parastagonospora nodorum]KAH6354355.1 hypothetical protein HBI37_021440 [Parastagonospora nodorum]
MAPMTEEGKLAEHLQKMLPLLQGPSAEVVAGAAPNIATWYIPQALRIVNSEYSRTACEEPIKKGILRKIVLLDCKPELFQRFVQWMYFATLPASETFRPCEAFQLWSLGEKLTASGFKDTLMTEIHTEQYSQLPNFFLDTFPQHWNYLTEYSKNKLAWLGLLAEHPDLSSFLLSALASKDIGREEALDTKPLAAYLEMPKN